MAQNGSPRRCARLRTQLLDGATPVPSPAAVVSRLVGIQAQDWTAMALAVRARTSGLTAAAVFDAVTAGELVVTWTLRGTRHLHHRDDVAGLLALFGPIYARPTKRDADLGIVGPVGERALARLRDALASADGPLTRAQVKDVLAPVGVDPTGQAAIHVIRRAALAGVLSLIRGPDGKDRYVPLRTGAAEATIDLARRYRDGFGPATSADFAAWTGRGLPSAQAEWRDAPTPAIAPPGPLRLLGGFDNLLLGYADRSDHLAPEHARRVNTGGGMVKPVVLDDGRVVGTWSAAGGVHLFPGERIDADAAEAELADARRFLTGPGRTPG